VKIGEGAEVPDDIFFEEGGGRKEEGDMFMP
jgi:hypothetical protein